MGRVTGVVRTAESSLYKELRRLVKRSPSVKAGVISGTDSETLSIAVHNEFGTENIPERPFIRQTYDEQEGGIAKLSIELARKTASGEMELENALGVLGLFFQDQVKKNITVNKPFKPNAEFTIKQKQGDTPLVDTGRLLSSISYEVDEG